MFYLNISNYTYIYIYIYRERFIYEVEWLINDGMSEHFKHSGRFPRGTQKGKSSHDDEYGHGQGDPQHVLREKLQCNNSCSLVVFTLN